MKKIILLLLVIGFHQSVFAKVLTVRRYGYGGAFWNIEQAVDSANTGDTVYIDLRNETQYWGDETIRKNITLSISDTNVSLNSLFIVTSTFKLENLKVGYLEFNGDNIEINQCYFSSGLEIRKGNCTINNSRMNYLWSYDTTAVVNLFNSIIGYHGDGRCYLKGSKISVCGNFLGKELVINSDEVVFNGNNIDTSQVLNFRITCDNLIFKGNKIIGIGSSNSYFSLAANEGVVSNNYFKRKTKYFNELDNNNTKFSVGEVFSTIDNPLIVSNNYFENYLYSGNQTLFDSMFQINTQMISSNIFNLESNYYDQSNYYFNYFGKNIFEKSRNSLINLNTNGINNFINGINVFNAITQWQFNSFGLDSLYRFILDSNLVINRGHDDPAFSDLDLSRNDIGPLGGPTPITNYQQTGGPNPRIWDVSLPRRTFYPSGSIPIRATGATK